MKQKLQMITRNQIAACIVVCSLAVIIVTSCKKSKSSEKNNAKFVGTWSGTQSCTALGSSSGNDNVSYLISAGANDNALIAMGAIGSDSSCSKLVSINLVANGNNLTLPSQTFTDLCGNSWTFSGSGTLNGKTLSVTQTISFTQSGFPITMSCSYTLTK